MKAIRHIAFAVLITVGIFSVVTYTSCSKDNCATVTCQNTGACTDGACVCPTGYEGQHCETLSRDKFVGIYVGNESCSAGNNQYPITLATSPDNVKLTMTNLFNNKLSMYVTISAPNIFTFSDTIVNMAYSGTGTLYNNQLTLQYQLTNLTSSQVNSCSFVGTK